MNPRCLLIFLFASLTASCKKTFTILPQNTVSATQYYRNLADANAAIIGLYGKFNTIFPQYLLLNEARADLLDANEFQDPSILELGRHQITSANIYTSPRPFYELVNNCNDILKNFTLMRQSNRLTVSQYNQLYSDVGFLRCWLYLQLGIHYGTIPYITEPVVNFSDLNDASKFPPIGFDALLDALIQFAESLPFKSPYDAATAPFSLVDTYALDKLFIEKNSLLGDLYLWKSNYFQAAINYRKVMEFGTRSFRSADEQYFEYYKVAYAYITGGNWPVIFSRPYGERYSNYEIIWDFPLDKRFAPFNPVIDLFVTAGKAKVKPSNFVINLWNAQFRFDSTPGDLRGITGSYIIRNGQPSVTKFDGGKVILYRAATLHLRFAEAANREGRDKIASALLNLGMNTTFDTTNRSDANRDVSATQQTFDTPPYDFDARQGTFPYFRAPWHRNTGIRQRVADFVKTVDSSRCFDRTVRPAVVTDRTFLTENMENLLIEEGALETAFEGNRWPDLLRIALRRRSTDPGYLGNKVAARFEAAGDFAGAAAVRARLADPANWYLPFKVK